ncbi:MAG: HisA/HisF-related TIM barrel protein [Bacteroidales bacterium]
MIAIPAIDIMDASCVRLVKGRFNQQMTYDRSPLDTARAIEAAGITHLHLVDLDGARQGQPVNLPVLEALSEGTSLRIDYGGGIRSMESIRKVLEVGARKVNLGTFLFSDPDIPKRCIDEFGPEKLIAAVDIDKDRVAVKGWQQSTETDTHTAIEALLKAGWRYLSVTDISRDGTMQGPDPGFYSPLTNSWPQASFIGGGGVASMEDLELLRSCGLYAAVTGKAIFEGKISLKDLSQFNYPP